MASPPRAETRPLDDSTLPVRYRRSVAALAAQYASLPPDSPVRLAKSTSNLFRPRARSSGPRLEVSGFSGLIDVDAAAHCADVGGMTTYEELVDLLLPFGLMPLVVPELKTITLGGAVTGLGIESSSFRNGMPHESVVEMDILTGSGDVVTARRDNEHRDLFFGFPNSYGTLGYLLRARIELEEVSPYVHLRHLAYSDVEELVETMRTVCEVGSHGGERGVDFVDGSVFSPSECYLTLGSWSDSAPATSDYTRSGIYYRSIQQRAEDWLTVRDYLWRWDTDWFWCSRAFMAQKPLVRRLAGPRFLRSDVYWRSWRSRTDIIGRHASTRPAVSPIGRASCRTSRSRSAGWWSSSRGSSARCRSPRSGCAPSASATGPLLGISTVSTPTSCM